MLFRSARAASLTCVCRVYEFNCLAMPFSLVFQLSSQHAPRLLRNRPVQPALGFHIATRPLDRASRRFHHVGYLQVLHRYQVVSPRQFRCDAMAFVPISGMGLRLSSSLRNSLLLHNSHCVLTDQRPCFQCLSPQHASQC